MALVVVAPLFASGKQRKSIHWATPFEPPPHPYRLPRQGRRIPAPLQTQKQTRTSEHSSGKATDGGIALSLHEAIGRGLRYNSTH